MNEYQVVCLMGKAGSGKDSAITQLNNKFPKNFNKIINLTTRPIRENEKDGVDYFFISKNEFLSKIKKDQLIEYTVFNNWYYGSSIESLNNKKINIGIFNPKTALKLKEKGFNVLYIYLNVSDKTRLIRQLNREDNPNVKEILRRFNTDEQDFKNIKPDIIINGENPLDLVVEDIFIQICNWAKH